MNDSVIRRRALSDEYVKIAHELTTKARSEISSKNFALTGDQSSTGKKAYPIEDEEHARSAVGFVGMHGTPQQKSEVYKDVAKKYPQLAAHSSVPALHNLAEKNASTMVSMGIPVSPSNLGYEDSLGENMLNGGLLGSTVGLLGAYGADKGPSHMLKGALIGGGIGALAGGAAHGARKLIHGKEKKAFMGAVKGGLQRAAKHLHDHEDAYELGGLGVLGAIGADRLQAHARAGAGSSNHAIEKKQLLGESGHAALDTVGLGTLAAPIMAKKLLGH